MQFFKKTSFDFIGARKAAFCISLVLIAVSVFSMVARRWGNLGIDFVGGTLVQVRIEPMPPMEDIRSVLTDAGFGKPELQTFPRWSEVIIRMKTKKGDTTEKYGISAVKDEGIPGPSAGESSVLSADANTAPVVSARAYTEGGTEEKILVVLRDKFPSSSAEIQRVEMIGPSVGKELTKKALLALFWGMIGIMVYVGWRFEFKYSAPAVIALIHDVVITLGLLSLLNKEISVTVIAAILTLAGYSINDTIVIYDRIREKMKLFSKDETGKVMNNAINDTLSRTVVTAGTTAAVLVAIFFLGGEVIHDFSFTMLIGVLIGTYSSIFVASPLVYEWESRHRKIKK